MGAALRFLESRARSTAEVRRRLVTHGYRPDLVEGCIERLTELGMLDDDAFARAWVESRDRARPRGERALRAELRQKGVDRPIVDDVLAGSRRSRSDDPIARGRRGRGPPAPEQERVARSSGSRILRARRQRAYALLARNGFDPDVAAAVAQRPASRPRADREQGRRGRPLP